MIKKVIVAFLISLILLTCMVFVTGCSSVTMSGFYNSLNEGVTESGAALFNWNKDKSCGYLLGFDNITQRRSINFEPIAFYNSYIYSVTLDRENADGDSAANITIDIFNPDGEIIKSISLGKFGSNSHSSGAAYSFSLVSKFYHEIYQNPNFADEEETYYVNQYKYGIVSTYYDKCIYVRDYTHCVKYDIINDTVAENPLDADDAFALNYSYYTAEDLKSVTIKNLSDGSSKVITLADIADSSPEIQEIVARYSNKKPLFEEETRTEEAFHDFSMVEIDGELYVVISTRNLMGMFLPLLLKYDYEANTFEFCVAGNGNTSYEPIAVVK